MTKPDDFLDLFKNLGEIFAALFAMDLMEWLMMTLGGVLLLIAHVKLRSEGTEKNGKKEVQTPFLKNTLKDRVRIGLVAAGIILIIGSVSEHFKKEFVKELPENNALKHFSENVDAMSKEERDRGIKEKSSSDK
jgi:hypothetical protein